MTTPTFHNVFRITHGKENMFQKFHSFIFFLRINDSWYNDKNVLLIVHFQRAILEKLCTAIKKPAVILKGSKHKKIKISM